MFLKKKNISPLKRELAFFEKIFFYFPQKFLFFLSLFFVFFGHFFCFFFGLVKNHVKSLPKKNKTQKVSEKNKKSGKTKTKFFWEKKKYFFKKTQVLVYGGKYFFFFKIFFSKKKKASKLSVFKNGHFQLCPHKSIGTGTSPPSTV